MDSDYFKTWQIIQFFSLSNEEQLLLIGKTRSHWFIEESNENIGANYLIGVCASCLEFCVSFDFDHDCIRNFRRNVLIVKDHFDPGFWNFAILSKSKEWGILREMAQICINELKPILYPLRKPFVIEDLIHVDHYTHASVVRNMLKNGKRNNSTSLSEQGQRKCRDKPT